MPYDIAVREGDNLPTLRRTLKNSDGTPLDLTGAAVVVKFVVKNAATGIQFSNHPCVIIGPPADGVVDYSWPTPLPPAGAYFAYYEVTDSAGKHLTIPNASTLSLLIESATLHGYSVSGQQVAQFLGRGSDNNFADLAQIHAEIVTDLARAYTRGKGFKNNQPNQELASVIIMATARVSVNPKQSKRIEVGPLIVTPGTLYGWTLTELAVLNRYRTRAM